MGYSLGLSPIEFVLELAGGLTELDVALTALSQEVLAPGQLLLKLGLESGCSGLFSGSGVKLGLQLTVG